jgi:hypothetical protein
VLAEPPVLLVPYQFKVAPGKAVAINALGVANWQYVIGVVAVGGAGVGNCAALLNEAEAVEVHVDTLAVTVYGVPTVMPEITPPAATVGPVGVKVYV